LETVESEQPDIVVTDLIMPDSDGLEVIMKLRHAKSEIPIIAMSGGGRVVDASHLESADIMGANATLQKPFDEAELNNLILKLVN
jgi:CheY-like chemotaxis protein